jgi:hypothetical protein
LIIDNLDESTSLPCKSLLAKGNLAPHSLTEPDVRPSFEHRQLAMADNYPLIRENARFDKHIEASPV